MCFGQERKLLLVMTKITYTTKRWLKLPGQFSVQQKKNSYPVLKGEINAAYKMDISFIYKEEKETHS